jgi:hypothetical protein
MIIAFTKSIKRKVILLMSKWLFMITSTLNIVWKENATKRWTKERWDPLDASTQSIVNGQFFPFWFLSKKCFFSYFYLRYFWNLNFFPSFFSSGAFQIYVAWKSSKIYIIVGGRFNVDDRRWKRIMETQFLYYGKMWNGYCVRVEKN